MHYAEIHFHLLPGIDDGPASMEESVALAAAAAAEGTRVIVATPHVNASHRADVSTLPARVAEVQDQLRREHIPVQVRCGGELAHEMVSRLSQRELDIIAHGPPGKRWLLLEASLRGIDDDYTMAAQELRGRGFAVVVAHPERALADRETGWPVLERELAAGSAMQVNAWSVAGCYGEKVRADAMRVLRVAPQVAIASDAHGSHRRPALAMALEALGQAGVPEAESRAGAVPLRLLEHGLPGPSALAA